MQACLIKIAAAFNAQQIVWALGASMMLYYRGLVSQPNDIDLMVSLGDIEPADKILREMGVKHPPNATSGYGTKYFSEYSVGDIDVDVMAGLVINYPGGAYEYKLDPKSFDTLTVAGTTIHLCPLEDWYIFYMLIPGRQNRVDSIEAYLQGHPCNTERLRFWLHEDIPQSIKAKVQLLLAGSGNSSALPQ